MQPTRQTPSRQGSNHKWNNLDLTWSLISSNTEHGHWDWPELDWCQICVMNTQLDAGATRQVSVQTHSIVLVNSYIISSSSHAAKLNIQEETRTQRRRKDKVTITITVMWTVMSYLYSDVIVQPFFFWNAKTIWKHVRTLSKQKQTSKFTDFRLSSKLSCEQEDLYRVTRTVKT